MKNNSYLLIVLTAIILSCNSHVDLDNMPTSDLLSVSSVISPQDSVFIVYIYQARGFGTVANSESTLVKDAQVIITDGIDGDTLAFNDDNNRYEVVRKNLTIEPLHTYFLKIETATGKKLEASCTIPPTPKTPKVEGQKEGDDFMFTVTWDNPAGFEFFTLAPLAQGTFEYTYPGNNDFPGGTRTDVISARFLDDIVFPSKDQISHNMYEGIVYAAFRAEEPKLKVLLRNVEVSLYLYLSSYQAYEEWQANNEGNLIPNFKEPQPIYTNIEGGVGIFAGFNQSDAEIEIL